MTRRVIPAILGNERHALENMADLAAGFCQYIQFDIMDGIFVPSTSIGIDDLTRMDIAVAWEAHLMVSNPRAYYARLRDAGASRVIFHFETVSSPVDEAEIITEFGMEAGMAVNPDTDIADIENAAAGSTDFVLFMSVHPGYYGKPFIPAVLDKIKTFKARCPWIGVGIDGGIKMDNIQRVTALGVDEICVGSAVFGTPAPATSYHELLGNARQGWSEYDENR